MIIFLGMFPDFGKDITAGSYIGAAALLRVLLGIWVMSK
jgi:hypothetical protein